MAEILVVVAVLSIAAAIGLPQLTGQREEDYNKQALASLESAWESAQDYYAGERGIGQDQGFQNSYAGFNAVAGLKLQNDLPWQGNTPPESFSADAGNITPAERWGKAVFITEASDQSLGLCSVSRTLIFCSYDDGQKSGAAGKTYGRRWGVGCTLTDAMTAAKRTDTDATASLGQARRDQRVNRPC